MLKKFLKIDREGFLLSEEGLRLENNEFTTEVFQNLEVEEKGFRRTFSTYQNSQIQIEAFDQPLVAQQIELSPDGLELHFPYELSLQADLNSFSLDSWDRLHGNTVTGLPFVLSHKAQAELFNGLDEFSDDSININGQTYQTPELYHSNELIHQHSFWSERYQVKNTPWDLQSPHPSLDRVLNRVKILKSRVINYGCGSGHDAALFSSLGHIVTGVDFSEEAITVAKKNHLGSNINFVTADVFNTPITAKYDLCFEHTLFCAIPPEKRKDLVKKWSQSLEEKGFLLGIFFVMPKRNGPPYGSSEWEIESLLEKHFDFLYWERLRDQEGPRLGSELMVFAQKKES